jgi:predicted RNase H-like nuclease (RuvC/YqgF family)
MYSKMRELERDASHLTEQNAFLTKQLKEKDLCISQLERSFFELKKEN